MENPTWGTKNLNPIDKGQTKEKHPKTKLTPFVNMQSTDKEALAVIKRKGHLGNRDRNKNALRKLRSTYTGLANNHRIDPKTKFHIALLKSGCFFDVLGDLIHQDLEFANLIQNQADNVEDLDLKYELQLKAARIRQPIEERLMKLMEMRYAVVKSETEINLIGEILAKWKTIDTTPPPTTSQEATIVSVPSTDTKEVPKIEKILEPL